MLPHGESIKAWLLLRSKSFLKKYEAYWPWLNQSSMIIGIDLGTSAVKVAQMTGAGAGLTLLKIAHVRIESDGKDPKPAILHALRGSLAGMDLKGARIVAVVNCPQTCVRTMTVPPMPSQELAEAIHWEAKDYISFPWEEAIWDYEITGETVEKGVKKLNITVAASPRKTIDHLLSFFADLGVNVSGIIPISAALQNVVQQMNSAPSETLAVIECGASITELNIYRNVCLAFSRKLSVAGKDITESLMTTLASERGKLQLNFQQAEEIKQKYGMIASEEDQWVEDKISTSQILSLVRPRIEQLVSDIESSLDFYREESRGGTVNRILLFGGGASLKRLAPFLSQQLGIKVEVGHPLEWIKVSADVHIQEPAMTGSFGLAIGAAAGEARGSGLSHAKNINLLPLELKEKTKRLVESVSLKAVMTAVIVMAGLFYAGMRIQVSAVDKKLQAAQLEYQGLQSEMGRLIEKAKISHLVQGHPSWGEAFKELSNVLPASMYLTELGMEDNTIIFKGIVHQNGPDMEVALSQFMLALENGIFKNVQLIKTQKLDPSSLEFEVSGNAE